MSVAERELLERVAKSMKFILEGFELARPGGDSAESAAFRQTYRDVVAQLAQ